MPKTNQNSNPIWLSLEQMLKYIKGNLLGKKKQEVDDQILASPLISEAIEGLREVKNYDKLQKTIDSLNRQIQLKSGAPALEPKIIKENAGSEFSFAKVWAVAASISIFGIATAAIWYFAANNENPNSNEGLVYTEKETLVANKESLNSSIPPDTLQATIDSTVNSEMLAFNLEESAANDAFEPLKLEESKTRKTEIANKDAMTSTKKEVEKPIAKKTTTANENELMGNSNKLGNTAEPSVRFNNEEISVDSIRADYEDKSNGYSSSKLKESTSTDAATYKQGLDYLKGNKIEEAKSTFSKIADNKNSEYKDDAIWNLAQIHIKEGDTKEAKKLLKKIKDSDKYGTLAKEAIDKL